MLTRLCSKSFKLGFSNMWSKKFQRYKLDLQRAEEPRSNCKHPFYHKESKGIPEKQLLPLHDYVKAFHYMDHNKLWKILQEMGMPDHLTCLLRNLYVGQEATVRTIHGTIDWFNIGKGIHQGCILSFCLFNLYAEYIKQNVMLDESLLLGLLAVYVLSHAHPCNELFPWYRQFSWRDL